jgi:hypothetical protein
MLVAVQLVCRMNAGATGLQKWWQSAASPMPEVGSTLPVTVQHKIFSNKIFPEQNYQSTRHTFFTNRSPLSEAAHIIQGSFTLRILYYPNFKSSR